MKEGGMVYVRKANGQHEKVRVIEVLDTTNGEVTASFERKEKPRPRQIPKASKGRGQSR